jgi:hypothetical protein
MEDKSTHFDHNSSVELKTEQHRLGEAKVSQIPSVGNNAMIARLAAKALILELQHSKLPSSEKKSTGSLQTRFKEQQQTIASNNEDVTMKETTKKRIIQLSLEYNILSPHTAFVGIEKRTSASNTDMVLREVPIQISADDQNLEFDSPMYASCHAPLFNSMPTLTPTKSSASSIDLDDRSLDMSVSKCLYNQAEFDSDCSDDYPTSLESFVTKSSMIKGAADSEKRNEDLWPTNNEDIVRHLIDKQKFDGSWDLDSKSIEQLTGKPLNVFQHLTNNQVLISAIVITVLETRFASLSSMWHGVVQKARKRLVDLLGKNIKKLDTLLEDIRKQL